jgi:hypothetical protein
MTLRSTTPAIPQHGGKQPVRHAWSGDGLRFVQPHSFALISSTVAADRMIRKL